MRLVLIEWQDSLGCSTEWQPLGNCVPVVLACKSVGWLVHNGKDCKVVVPHISADRHPNAKDQGCGDMTIPSRSILSMITLLTPKSRKGKRSKTSAFVASDV